MSKSLARFKERGLSFLTGGGGEPFLLLHGIPGSALVWQAAGTLLTERYKIIIPDLLGFGQSSVPQGDYYMEAQATAISQLLTDLGVTSLYLGGHDFGGPVAITMMRMFPELKINGLVLSATNVFTDTYIPPPLRVASVPVLNTLMFKAMAGNRIGLGMMYLAATKNKSEASWEKFKKHLTPSGVELTWRIFQRSLADLKTNYSAVEDMLLRIETPTLVLWGDSDPFFAPSVAERIHESIEDSQLRIYKSTGHFVPEEQPNMVTRDILCFFEEN